MKNFVFKYESILKMRSDKVDEIMAGLKELNEQMERLEESLGDVARRKSEYMAHVSEKLRSGCASNELQAIRNSYEYFSAEADKVNVMISKLGARIEEERDKLVETSREKRIIEKLKEKDEVVHKEEAERIEQKITEELVNYRNFKRDGR
jgi:flagellar protein FliJ